MEAYRSFMRGSRAIIALVAVGAITVLGLLLPIGATPEVYVAVTGGIQAFGVVMALAIALLAQSSQISDRRVDRVLDLHRELTSGPTGEARTRLGWFYRDKRVAGRLPRLTRGQLRSAKYDPASEDQRTPRMDSDRILRFFERANAARLRGSLDEYTAALLLGRHATWWDQAIKSADTDPTRSPLTATALWATEYANKHRTEAGFEGWATRTELDFGDPRE